MSTIGSVTEAAKPQETTALGGLDKDAFLKLLVAQLRYQNPMEPLDGQEYMAQAAQFAAVERLDGLAKAQAEVVTYQKMLIASSMIGRHVQGTNADVGTKVDGVVRSVKFTDGTPMLDVDGQSVQFDSIEEVTA
jgi:flagellar basal-body rod modification protein FlgD